MMKNDARLMRLPRYRRFRLLRDALFEALEPRLLLSTNVLQWGNGLNGNAVYPMETTLSSSNVNSSTFGKLRKITLPGGSGDQVYAQPLIVNGINVTGHGINKRDAQPGHSRHRGQQ